MLKDFDLTKWLMSMINPIVVKVMSALGVSVMTVKGVDVAFDQVLQSVNDAKGQMSPEVLQIMGLFGMDTAISWVLGAISFAFTVWTASKFFSFFSINGN